MSAGYVNARHRGEGVSLRNFGRRGHAKELGRMLKGKHGLAIGSIDPETGLTQTEIEELSWLQDEIDKRLGRT